MSADILSDPNYPHGTTEGFANGCRGRHCPAPVICREVHYRYQGDYAFRKALDSGLTAEEVVDRERGNADAGVSPPDAAPRTRNRRTTGPDGRPVPNTAYQRRIVELVNKGLTDRQVAMALGKTRDQAAASRKALGLPSNRTPANAGVSSS